MSVNGLIKKVLSEVGLSSDRFDLQWASAAEGPRFVKLITDFTARIKNLGPLGEAEGISGAEAQKRAEKALEMVSDRKLRMAFGNVTKTLRLEVPALDDKTIASLIDEKLTKTITSLGG